tara:strand:- start:18 stop:389 length:372 start_codon:yes stop_codon:yes gene_type:complete
MTTILEKFNTALNDKGVQSPTVAMYLALAVRSKDAKAVKQMRSTLEDISMGYWSSDGDTAQDLLDKYNYKVESEVRSGNAVTIQDNSDRILQLQNRIARLSSNKLHNANPIHHAEQEIINLTK